MYRYNLTQTERSREGQAKALRSRPALMSRKSTCIDISLDLCFDTPPPPSININLFTHLVGLQRFGAVNLAVLDHDAAAQLMGRREVRRVFVQRLLDELVAKVLGKEHGHSLQVGRGGGGGTNKGLG